MDGFEKREECISNLIQQIGWIEDIDAHKFPGWGHTVNAMRQAIALLQRSFTPEEVYDTVIEHAQHDMRFKLGDKIDYSLEVC